MAKIPHKWHFKFTDKANSQLAALRPSDRMRVLRSIEELLKSDNPTRVDGVKQIEQLKPDKVYRQRQGNYRIFFTLESGKIVHLKFTYKGMVYILSIQSKDDHTYKR